MIKMVLYTGEKGAGKCHPPGPIKSIVNNQGEKRDHKGKGDGRGLDHLDPAPSPYKSVALDK